MGHLALSIKAKFDYGTASNEEDDYNNDFIQVVNAKGLFDLTQTDAINLTENPSSTVTIRTLILNEFSELIVYCLNEPNNPFKSEFSDEMDLRFRNTEDSPDWPLPAPSPTWFDFGALNKCA